MNREQLEPWLAEYVEQKSDDIARLITERVLDKLRVVEKLRVLETDRSRVGLDDDTLIALLPLSSRLIGALQRAGVKTLGDLNGVSESALRRWRNVGQASIEQLRRFLALAGRALPPGGAACRRAGENPGESANAP